MNSSKLALGPSPSFIVIILRTTKTVVSNTVTVKLCKPILIGRIVGICFFSISTGGGCSYSISIRLNTGYISNIIITVNKGFVKSLIMFSGEPT